MTLSSKQSIFLRNVASLIVWAYGEGYFLTFGEAYRPKEMAEIYAKKGKGIKSSLHCDRLAIDFNLFINGKFMTKTEDHRPLGEFWKGLNPMNCWGGDFKRKDGNHYSMRHGKRK